MEFQDADILDNPNDFVKMYMICMLCIAMSSIFSVKTEKSGVFIDEIGERVTKERTSYIHR